MDRVLAEFDEAVIKKFKERYPQQPCPLLESRQHFYIKENFPQEWQCQAEAIYHEPGFIRNLAPIAGRLEALCDLQQRGEEIFICTSPLSEYKNCVLEKYEWVEEHLGSEWTKRIILTKDKTAIRGNILIDDKPHVTGLHLPEWEHVLYMQPYNFGVVGKRRLTWKDYKTVLGYGPAK